MYICLPRDLPLTWADFSKDLDVPQESCVTILGEKSMLPDDDDVCNENRGDFLMNQSFL